MARVSGELHGLFWSTIWGLMNAGTRNDLVGNFITARMTVIAIIALLAGCPEAAVDEELDASAIISDFDGLQEGIDSIA
ncbi:MAG: hypothetical protein OXI01_19895 [Albidovulum sp.]|nr:hypothetical protein [Albidovulum sp.]